MTPIGQPEYRLCQLSHHTLAAQLGSSVIVRVRKPLKQVDGRRVCDALRFVVGVRT
jgi:hypothetical protein